MTLIQRLINRTMHSEWTFRDDDRLKLKISTCASKPDLFNVSSYTTYVSEVSRDELTALRDLITQVLLDTQVFLDTTPQDSHENHLQVPPANPH